MYHHSEDQRLGDHRTGITEITSSKIGPAIINNSATKDYPAAHQPDSLAPAAQTEPDRARDGPD
jgi:hypothetical protein